MRLGSFIIFELALSLLILFIGVGFWLRPPRKINGVYGYRTRLSMSSQEAWDEANRYSSFLTMGWSLLAVFVQGLLHFFLPPKRILFVTCMIWLSLLILTLLLTERHLARKFDKSGKKKNSAI